MEDQRLKRLAWLLDSSIPIPGLKFRIGLDAIVGLIPGVGDFVGVALSSYIVARAARLGAPPTVLARMAMNIAIEAVVGLVPLLGDLFDAAWKANQRNVRLLAAYVERPETVRRRSGLVMLGVVAGLALAVGAFGVVAFVVLRWLLTTLR
jgi:uncharacterized protein DUF4112